MPQGEERERPERDKKAQNRSETLELAPVVFFLLTGAEYGPIAECLLARGDPGAHPLQDLRALRRSARRGCHPLPRSAVALDRRARASGS